MISSKTITPLFRMRELVVLDVVLDETMVQHRLPIMNQFFKACCENVIRSFCGCEGMEILGYSSIDVCSG